MSKIRQLLRVTDEDVDKVRKLYHKTEKDIEEDLSILLEWLSKQPHLPAPHDRGRLERFLLKNKFRIEQTKTKLDNYYASKSLYPEFYLNPESDALRNVRKCCTAVPMPKLLPNGNRLVVVRTEEDQERNFNMIHLAAYFILFWELELSYDYSAATVIIWDFKHLTVKYVLRTDINDLRRMLFIFHEAFSARISAFEFVNLPQAFEVLLTILKAAMNVKLFGKIRLHKDLSSLHEAIPKEYLPTELGGYEESIHDISEKCNEELVLQKDFLQEQAKRSSNEKLRVGKPVSSELFGTDGTFRKINLD